MPLVIVSGLPCSGKTFWSHELLRYIQENLPANKTVELVSEEDYGAERPTTYGNSNNEKKARGNFISTLERKITKDNIVIADGMNYIKGYRYQIYCIARAQATPHVSLYTVASESQCRQRNADRKADATYSPSCLEELFMRFEEPNNQSRWDSPMFTVSEGEPADWAPLLTALLGAVARPPSMSTAIKAGDSSDLVLLLNEKTQAMTSHVLQIVKQVGVPTMIKFPSYSFVLKRSILSSDLQKIRRQFIHMNRLHQIDPDNLEQLFAQYLDNNLRS